VRPCADNDGYEEIDGVLHGSLLNVTDEPRRWLWRLGGLLSVCFPCVTGEVIDVTLEKRALIGKPEFARTVT
jgi:hypothetical protein